MAKVNKKLPKVKLPKTKQKTVAKLTAEESYWNTVDQQAHYLVADLLNKILPLPNLRDKQNLDLEKDADYRNLFFALENNYREEENLPSPESLAEQIAYEYLLLVIKSLLSSLSQFSCHLGFEELSE